MVRPSYVYRYKNRNFVLLRNTRGSKYTLSFANGFLIFLDRSSLLFSSPLFSSHLSSTKFRELRVENGNSTRTMISPPFTFRRKFTNAIAALPRVRHSSCSWPVWEEEGKKKKKGKGRRGTLQVTHTITHTGVARRARRFVVLSTICLPFCQGRRASRSLALLRSRFDDDHRHRLNYC